MEVAVISPPGTRILSSEPFIQLTLGISDFGHQVTIDPTRAREDLEAFVAIGHQPQRVTGLQMSRVARGRRILVVMEPRVTTPGLYTRGTLATYGKIFAGSPLWAEELRSEAFIWPQNVDLNPLETHNDFDATMIYSNKRSAVRGSMYGLRRDVIREGQMQGMAIAVAGPGWSAPPSDNLRAGLRAVSKSLLAGAPPNLREALSKAVWKPDHALGIAAVKSDVLQRARCSIVIENSADYVSEKLFDVIRHGVAAIYVGPRLDTFGIPEDVAITAEANPREIIGLVGQCSESDLKLQVARASAWLASSEGRAHRDSDVLRELGRRIGRYLSK